MSLVELHVYCLFFLMFNISDNRVVIHYMYCMCGTVLLHCLLYMYYVYYRRDGPVVTGHHGEGILNC